MNDSFFEKNLAALRALNPHQAESIAQLAPRVEARLYTSYPTGAEGINLAVPDSTGVAQPLFLSDQPEEEIEAAFNQIQLEAEEKYTLLLLGFGLGIYIERLLQIIPAKGILAVVEPDALIFFSAFYRRDLSKILRDPRVHFYIGQKSDKAVESIGRELQWSRFLSLPYQILIHPYIHRIRPEFIVEFCQLWRDALQRELMFRHARAEHSATVVSNTVKNLKSIMYSPGVSNLYGQFPNIPAVLVSAGPSAEKSLPFLREHAKRFMITCVNTAYPLLRSNGIDPQFVFTMDHQERNLLSFQENAPSEKTFLIADPRVNPQIVQHFDPQVFLASWRTTLEQIGEPAPLEKIPVPEKSGNSIYHWLQSIIGYKGDVFGAGSVAVAGFHILARMGCQPIILVGQDLAFMGEKTYAAGTIFDNQNLTRDSDTAHWVTSNEGEWIGTSETLYLYRQMLEHEIQRFGIPVFNTGAGAVIKGTITSRLENILYEIPRITADITEYTRGLMKNYRPAIPRLRLQGRIQEARNHLFSFSEEAKVHLLHLPDEFKEDMDFEEKADMLTQLEESIELCTKNHPLAMDLLNELLQEIHLEFEESRWRFHVQPDQEAILDEKILAHARVLDTFVRQADLLITLIEENRESL